MASGVAEHDVGRGIIASCRRCAAAALLMARVDARRPASWGAVLAAAAAVDVGLLLAVPCAALAAAAGVGDPPRGVAEAARRPAAIWWIVRCVWPLTGAALMAGAGGDALSCAVVAAVVVGTALVMFAAATRGLPAADATSSGLVPALVAALAGLVSVSSGHAWLPAAGLGWLVTAGAALRLAAANDAVEAWRRGVQVAAMTTTLAAMAGCYFLAPEHARWYALLVAAWFVGAALPQAALGAGTLDEAARERLLCCALPATAVRGAPRPVVAVVWRAVGVSASWAALLGWPAMVAAALWGGDAARVDGPLMAVATLAVLVAALTLVAGVVRWAGGAGETTFAACAGLAVAAATWLSPALPVRPTLPRPLVLVAGIVSRIGVERFGRSCQTSQVPQPGRTGAVLPQDAGTDLVRVQKGGLIAR